MGNLRKIEHCTRSCRWPDLFLEEQQRQIEVPWEEAPLLTPGSMPAGRVVHPMERGSRRQARGSDISSERASKG